MSLAAACILTILTETAFLAACGYRSGAFLTVCAAVNAATNLTLNLLLSALSGAVDITWIVYVLEALAVVAEYAVFAAIEGRDKRLLLLTIAANVISYSLGLLISGHV